MDISFKEGVKKWLSYISFRYISNFSIIVCIFAYYTNAYSIFFILAALVITNLILILFLEYFDLDKLFIGISNINNANANIRGLKDSDSNNIDLYNYSKMQFVIFNTLWHIIPVIWLYYIFNKDNLIYTFKPNFMTIFFQASIIILIYFYFGSKNMVYGDINYAGYLIIYCIILLGVSYSLYVIK